MLDGLATNLDDRERPSTTCSWCSSGDTETRWCRPTKNVQPTITELHHQDINGPPTWRLYQFVTSVPWVSSLTLPHTTFRSMRSQLASMSASMKARCVVRRSSGTVKSSLGFTPRHAFGVTPAAGYDTVVMVSDDYAIHEYASWHSHEPIWFHHRLFRPPAIHDHPACRCRLHQQARQGSGVPRSGRDQLCRPHELALKLSCASLRAFGDFLVALNTQEGATKFPEQGARVEYHHSQ